MSLVVNFFGGPGAGKSTIAAAIFVESKKRGINCELLTEYAKDLVWEENRRGLEDQLYVFANQAYKQELLRRKVDLIITDSPILLSMVYNADQTTETFKKVVLERFLSFQNLNYLVQRSYIFEETGRIHNLAESKKLDAEIIKCLDSNGIEYRRTWIEDNTALIFDEIKETLDNSRPRLAVS